ncbi:hypothetical protein [Actinoplanes regularis]|uniref:Uncharacterized protein n=1 Tax=Actinoplanes regularis TaxID=52697 RepID=A0A238WLT2_9ACTN|nr:hypothetical protein [Actinoplanes regularis]GIE84761.1 hypothetical protein Are01nite_12410 [Actinoplanes regularis]SNR47331.1 hypothetical protein SAMN06264365_102663 [Actinoplanes regularis]
MPTAGPYRLQRRLSSCEVGDVWSAADARGLPLTVARLNELASADDRWRSAFAAASEALGQSESDRLPIVDSDHASNRPWVACSGTGAGAAEIFTALGQQLQPVAAEHGPPAADDATVGRDLDFVRPEPDPPTVPFQPVARPISAQPVSAAAGQPVSAYPGSPQPVSGRPVSGDPSSGLPAFGDPISAAPISAAPPPYGRIGDGPRPDRLLLLIVALVSLLLGAAAGAGLVAATAGDDPKPSPSTAPVTYTDAQLLLPATPPARPGLLPDPDDWPKNTWPTFEGQSTGVQDVTDLDGVGFDFKVPDGWKCTLAAKAEAAVHYRCGVFDGETVEAGGDLIVRTCVAVCDDAARQALRKREEAWGLRWTGGTSLQSWVETDAVEGKPVYGVVYVGFWRSTPEEVLNREVVLRMTAPAAAANDVKKVAYTIRDHTYTQ